MENENIIEVERKWCPDCETWVQAEYKFNNEFNTFDWICLECGYCIESYET